MEEEGGGGNKAGGPSTIDDVYATGMEKEKDFWMKFRKELTGLKYVMFER